MKYRLDKWTVRWIKNWLNCQAQRILISSTKSRWRPVTSGVPQGLILGPMLFNVFINNVGDGTEYTQVCRWYKTGRMVNTPDGCAAIQKDLDRLENWANMGFMKFGKGNAKSCT